MTRPGTRTRDSAETSAQRDHRPDSLAERQMDQARRGGALWSTGLSAAPRGDITTGAGRAPTPGMRRSIEKRFGQDLSGVRLHDDATAAQIAQDRDAHAVTSGQNIYFDHDALRRDTAEGHARLKHELIHVAQQLHAGGSSVVLADERTAGGGYGATPPRVPYEVAEGGATETAHVLFEHDDIHVTEESLASAIAAVSNQQGPIVVELHGYASVDGAARYNENLSAHRAARVERELLPHLPPGSEVQLIAHGETSGFGDGHAPNRRVGVLVRPRAQAPQSEGPAALPLGPRVTPDVDPAPPPGSVPLDTSELPSPDAVPEAPPPWLIPSIYRPTLDFGTPDPLRLDLPILRPTCPFAPGSDQMDWFEIMRPLRGRGGQLTTEQTLSLVQSWSSAACTYSRMLTPILGPELATTTAARGVNMGISSAMESSAYWENPNFADQHDQWLRRQGIETTIIPVSDIILGIHSFLAD